MGIIWNSCRNLGHVGIIWLVILHVRTVRKVICMHVDGFHAIDDIRDDGAGGDVLHDAGEAAMALDKVNRLGKGGKGLDVSAGGHKAISTVGEEDG